MFSIVVSTKRDIEALRPLFVVSSDESEMIIIDSDYNEETKKQLKEIEHDFYSLTYAPPRSEKKYKRDHIICMNTGFAYAENEWIIKLDDSSELKPDFFEIVKQDIKLANEKFDYKNLVLRIVKLEEWSGHKKWEMHPSLKKSKYDFYFIDRNGIDGMFRTLDSAVFRRDGIDLLNGYDERYDIGHGYDDNDAYQRFLTARYWIILDRGLMLFQKKHNVKKDYIDFTKILFDMTMREILNGKYKAYNDFDMKELRSELLCEKDKYKL